MVKQSLMKRKPKANVAQKFVGVLSKDKQGRPKTLIVPGSHGKQYHVILRRYRFASDYNMIECECRLCAGYKGYIDCPGNTFKNLCYHSRAAVDFALAEAGYEAAWCQEYQAALSVNHLKKGQIFKVRSRQSKVEVFIVVSKKVGQLEMSL